MTLPKSGRRIIGQKVEGSDGSSELFLKNSNYRRGFPTIWKARNSKTSIVKRTIASSGAHFLKTISRIPSTSYNLC